MYENDSFFTLGLGSSIGLIGLSAFLSIGLLVLGWRQMRGRGWATCLGIAFALFAIFVWLSPQVYYTYYRMLFDGLPAQWVVHLPQFGEMFGLVTFTGPATLADHSQALLFWMLVILAIVPRDRSL